MAARYRTLNFDDVKEPWMMLLMNGILFSDKKGKDGMAHHTYSDLFPP